MAAVRLNGNEFVGGDQDGSIIALVEKTRKGPKKRVNFFLFFVVYTEPLMCYNTIINEYDSGLGLFPLLSPSAPQPTFFFFPLLVFVAVFVCVLRRAGKNGWSVLEAHKIMGGCGNAEMR
jgi:hypothetical protein